MNITAPSSTLSTQWSPKNFSGITALKTPKRGWNWKKKIVSCWNHFVNICFLISSPRNNPVIGNDRRGCAARHMCDVQSGCWLEINTKIRNNAALMPSPSFDLLLMEKESLYSILTNMVLWRQTHLSWCSGCVDNSAAPQCCFLVTWTDERWMIPENIFYPSTITLTFFSTRYAHLHVLKVAGCQSRLLASPLTGDDNTSNNNSVIYQNILSCKA